MKKILSFLMVITLGLSACSSDESSEDKTLVFWSAPNVQQFEFWNKKAEEYNSTTDSGYTIEIQQMPENPSSEAGIQNAIATNEPPVASENVTRGFATELSESGAIKNLDDIDGFSELVENRNMDQAISSWDLSGSNYVFPIYSVPMLMTWNTDLLEENGVTEIPTSFDEVLAAAEKFDGSDQFLINGTKYMLPENWWEQWFYTFTYYYSESEGQGFYEDGELVADDDAMIAVLEYIDTLADTNNGLFVSDAVDPFENGIAAQTFIGGWQIPFWEESYPDLEYGVNYELSAPVNTDGDGQYTFADAKGIAFYEGYSDEQYNEMMNFVSYVFSEEGDLDWMETTGLTSARDDLLDNEMFSTYFEENPALMPFAEAVPYAIPAMNSSDMVEIQTQLGKNIQEMITSDLTPEEAWENTKSDIEGITNE